MPDIQFARESFVDVIDEALPILEAQAAELNANPDLPLAVDREAYQNVDDAGVLRIFTARIDGALVGYACFHVAINPHYSTSPPQSVQDVFYVEQSARGAGIGDGLIKYCNSMLAFEGVNIDYQHVKLAHPGLRKLLEANGYTVVEWVMSKRLS
jgi:GNAT superfamily N-acetyltransferase